MSYTLFGRLQIPVGPRASKWSKAMVQKMIDRTNKRINIANEKDRGIVIGRTVPNHGEVAFGDGNQCRVSVLFLDICGFSALPNWTPEEQQSVLLKMNLFMSEMIAIVRDRGGHFEKNTGDGLMAYFGESLPLDTEKVQMAVEAALAMHYFNDILLGPCFDSSNIPRVRFRIGVDVGPVTLAKIGVKSIAQNYSSLVAIGTTANVACKLMNLIPDGGICLGEHAFNALSRELKELSVWSGECSTFKYTETNQTYCGYELTYRYSDPIL